jgi:hypothetical protein
VANANFNNDQFNLNAWNPNANDNNGVRPVVSDWYETKPTVLHPMDNPLSMGTPVFSHRARLGINPSVGYSFSLLGGLCTHAGFEPAAKHTADFGRFGLDLE